MTVGGWTFMLVSVTFVTGLFLFCFSRILRGDGSRNRAGTDTGQPRQGK